MYTLEYQETKYQEMICRTHCKPGELNAKIMELQDEIKSACPKGTKAVMVHLIVPEGEGYYTLIMHRHIHARAECRKG